MLSLETIALAIAAAVSPYAAEALMAWFRLSGGRRSRFGQELTRVFLARRC
jgi:hypothetical protein